MQLFLDYRTISGVNGPLVVLENLKVSDLLCCAILVGASFL